MQAQAERMEFARKLQAQINRIQGFGKVSGEPLKEDFAPFTAAFPGHIFPIGAVHEFISYEPSEAASTNGFVTALAGKFMKEDALCLWVANERKVFPYSLKHFGFEPDRIVFINAAKQKDLLWIIEEALKCEALTVVIGEIKELSFTESRRLQLAVERSSVNCFIHRYQPHSENAVACTTRWKITPLPGISEDGLPGVGHSCWDVQLLKVRNGRPSFWKIRWAEERFMPVVDKMPLEIPLTERHAV